MNNFFWKNKIRLLYRSISYYAFAFGFLFVIFNKPLFGQDVAIQLGELKGKLELLRTNLDSLKEKLKSLFNNLEKKTFNNDDLEIIEKLKEPKSGLKNNLGELLKKDRNKIIAILQCLSSSVKENSRGQIYSILLEICLDIGLLTDLLSIFFETDEVLKKSFTKGSFVDLLVEKYKNNYSELGRLYKSIFHKLSGEEHKIIEPLSSAFCNIYIANVFSKKGLDLNNFDAVNSTINERKKEFINNTCIFLNTLNACKETSVDNLPVFLSFFSRFLCVDLINYFLNVRDEIILSSMGLEDKTRSSTVGKLFTYEGFLFRPSDLEIIFLNLQKNENYRKILNDREKISLFLLKYSQENLMYMFPDYLNEKASGITSDLLIEFSKSSFFNKYFITKFSYDSLLLELMIEGVAFNSFLSSFLIKASKELFLKTFLETPDSKGISPLHILFYKELGVRIKASHNFEDICEELKDLSFFQVFKNLKSSEHKDNILKINTVIPKERAWCKPPPGLEIDFFTDRIEAGLKSKK